MVGIKTVMFAGLVLLFLLLAGRWWRRNRPPKPSHSPLLSLLPPVSGSDHTPSGGGPLLPDPGDHHLFPGDGGGTAVGDASGAAGDGP